MPDENVTPERQRTRDSIARKLGGNRKPPKRKPLKVAKKKVEKEAPTEALMVVASNPGEMQVAQRGLVAWASRKMVSVMEECEEVDQNLATAEHNGWKTSSLKSLLSKAVRRHEYYEKVHAALVAGYVVVPNFAEIDIFAMRTRRKKPASRDVSRGNQFRSPTPDEFTMKLEKPSLGEGEYKDPEPTLRYGDTLMKNRDGDEVKRYLAWPDELQGVDFPFKAVKPRVMDDTAKAMALKIFDQIGVIPRRRAKADPMVIGQIVYGSGYTEKAVSFLITWWLQESDLEV
jgi:hypothetical protein